jgi:hypothetical protein
VRKTRALFVSFKRTKIKSTSVGLDNSRGTPKDTPLRSRMYKIQRVTDSMSFRFLDDVAERSLHKSPICMDDLDSPVVRILAKAHGHESVGPHGKCGDSFPSPHQ